MRTYIHRTKESVKSECLERFPNGEMYRKKDVKNVHGLFLWMDRNMGGFRNVYEYIYGKSYIDRRSLVDRTGKNNGMYGVHRRGINAPSYGKHLIESAKDKIRKANTKHGKSSEFLLIRCSYEGVKWRDSVFKRDNFTCQTCKRRGYTLNAHHIKEFAKYPELRFDINNGITLCYDCHKKIHEVF